MAHNTVELVSTMQVALSYYPGRVSSGSLDHTITLHFPVDSTKCHSEVGRWLAETVTSTAKTSPGSQVLLLHPITKEGMEIRAMAQRMVEQPEVDAARAEALYDEIEQWLARRRAAIEMEGEACFEYRIVRFVWPVFGSKAIGRTDVADAYFDICARQIRDSGAVILCAGPHLTPLPLRMAQALAHGHGHRLLARYWRDPGAQPPIPVPAEYRDLVLA